MNTRPYTAIIQDYDAISEQCKKTGAPIYLIKDGEPDLVVMSAAAFEQRENMLKLREQLLAAEEARARGEKGYTIEESVAVIKKAIDESSSEER